MDYSEALRQILNINVALKFKLSTTFALDFHFFVCFAFCEGIRGK